MRKLIAMLTPLVRFGSKKMKNSLQETVRRTGGRDTYTFNPGDGQDTILDTDPTAGNLDTIVFGEGIEKNDLTFTRSGLDLVLSINGTTDKLTLKNWGDGDANYIERMQFADGTVWDTAQIQALIPVPVGTAGDDTLYAWKGDAATLYGLGGNDALVGNSGDSAMDGGAGNVLPVLFLRCKRDAANDSNYHPLLERSAA